MNNNKPRYINSLVVGERFRLTGDPRMANTWMMCEGVRSEGGRTLVRVRYEVGGSRQEFHRPGLTVIEVS